MDRLLCGDVGYGKTELAMRAVFKAVQDGKQAAILVPVITSYSIHYTKLYEIAQNLEDAVLRQHIRSRLSALLRKERHKLENVGGDEERLEEGRKGGEFGETLKANLPSLRKGMVEFHGIRITSYNVCYTKLLRLPAIIGCYPICQ